MIDTEGEPIALSMTAEWLLAAVVGSGGTDPVGALVRHDPALAEAAARDLDVDLAEAVTASTASRAVGRDEVVRRACAGAAAAGRPVASSADVAGALLRIVVERGREAASSDALGAPSEAANELTERVVRVFISSTFRDMHEERDVLVKRVFPELRRRCRERGVELVDVDLRWGITREQAERGEVLPVCLAEIGLCRPYFIGLLGERYGWVPPGIAPEVVAAHPWLAERAGRSVTELEMLHGALDDPTAARRAFFYLRDPAFSRTVDPARRADFEAEGAAAVGRLRALKQRIRESGHPVREAYPDPQALGALVLADLAGAIDADFPAGAAPDRWARERVAHATFARSRTRVYIERPDDFDRLDAHAAGDGPPLVVTGAPGSGKSALVANWVARRRALEPDVPIVYHAVPASAQSADHRHVGRRLIVELLRAGSEPGADPATGWVDALDDDEVPRTLASALSGATAGGRRVVLVLDGVDQLADAPGARELLWLPDDPPAGVRLVVTARTGPVADAARRRGWTLGEVAPLDPAARGALAERYLWHTYRKRLDARQVARIAAAPQSANPLFLRALLEELRVFGVFERVDERIGHYLGAPSVVDLYGLVLERLEADHEPDRPGLVRDALTAIRAGRRGLSEPELLAVTGAPMAVWSPLRLALEESLISRDGVLGLFHDELRHAIDARYLPRPSDVATAHLRLADHFERAEPDERRAEELPFQLAEAGAWDRLAATLADAALTDCVWRAEPSSLRAWWRSIGEHGGPTPPQAYAPVLVDAAAQPLDVVWSVALLLSTMGYAADVVDIQRDLVERARAAGHAPLIQAGLGNLAVSLAQLGRREEALECHRQEEAICRNHGLDDELQKCLANQVALLDRLGRHREALEVLDEAEALCRRSGDAAQLAHRLHARAQLLSSVGDLEGAFGALREAGRLIEALADREDLGYLAEALNDLGVAHKQLGDLDYALEAYREAERISRAVGHRRVLQASLVNEGNVLGRRGDHEAADRLFAEAEAICRRTNDRDALMRCLFNRAYRRLEAGRADDAVPMAEEALALATELGADELLPHVVRLVEEARSRLW